MDPFTAFAAAGNVLQFAELGINLIRKTIEYSKDGGCSEHQRLQDVVQRLMVSSAHLHQSLQNEVDRFSPDEQDQISDDEEDQFLYDEEAQFLSDDEDQFLHDGIEDASKLATNGTRRRRVEPGPKLALYLANKECLRVSKELFKLLDSLKLNRYGSVWRSARLALVNVRKRQQLERLQNQARDARSNLILSFLVYIESRSTDRYKDLKAGSQGIVEEIEKMFRREQYFKRDVESLTSKLSNLDIALFKLATDEKLSKVEREEKRKEWVEAECIAASLKNETKLQNHGRTFDNVFARLDNEVSAVISQFQRLKSAIDHDLVPRRRILQSLYFTHMNGRRDRVRRAHGNTYQWMFKSKGDGDNGSAIWDDFVQWLCHNDGSNRYWISGKPGSGKTTLMRELDERITGEASSNIRDVTQKDVLQAALQKWVGAGDLLKGCCYFWYAGSADQKSLAGLLRSLVRHLLEQRPDLIDKVVSVERWDTAVSSEFYQQPWEEKELLGVLERIIDQTKHEDKVLLFVDGLDEYEGSDERRNQLLDIIRRLTDSTHVKACVASRPWNIFRDEFEHCAKLRLEDLTKEDIRTFVREKLEADKLFQQLQRRDPTLLERIDSEINDKAQGVFLWVHLVVRDLLKVIRDGGRSMDLFLELERIPSDLEEYFKRMLETIEPAYRMEAAKILQTALCSMDYVKNDTEDLASGPDLWLLHLEYLESFTDPCFAARDQIRVIDQDEEEDDYSLLVNSLNRRLSSRCTGLLETNTSSWLFLAPAAVRWEDVWCLKVEFLHRTVKDFLQRPQTQKMLTECQSEPFDAYLFRCNLLVADVATSMFAKDTESRLGDFCCFFWHITNRSNSENASFALFEKMARLLIQQSRDFRREERFLSGKFLSRMYDTILHCDQECDTAMSLAIKLERTPYIQSKLMKKMIHEKTGRPLLDYALRPCYYPACKPCLWVVQKLLDMGADPCASFGVKRNLPVWAAFVVSTGLTNDLVRTTIVDAVTMLLKCDIRSSVSAVDLRFILTDLRRKSVWWRSRGGKDSEAAHAAYTETIDSLIDLFDGPSSLTRNVMFSEFYTLDWMLNMLSGWRGSGGDKDPFFTEQEIIHFEVHQWKPDEAELTGKRQRVEDFDLDASDIASAEGDSKRQRAE